MPGIERTGPTGYQGGGGGGELYDRDRGGERDDRDRDLKRGKIAKDERPPREHDPES
jgi:hypothetical protein